MPNSNMQGRHSGNNILEVVLRGSILEVEMFIYLRLGWESGISRPNDFRSTKIND